MVIAALLIAAPVVALILPIQVHLGDPLPVPGLPVEPHQPVLFALAAIPFVLAAGFLEPVWACAVGALTGLAIGYVDTHVLFTMLEYAGFGHFVQRGNKAALPDMVFSTAETPSWSSDRPGFVFRPDLHPVFVFCGKRRRGGPFGLRHHANLADHAHPSGGIGHRQYSG